MNDLPMFKTKERAQPERRKPDVANELTRTNTNQNCVCVCKLRFFVICTVKQTAQQKALVKQNSNRFN